jgi:hypothetical protein
MDLMDMTRDERSLLLFLGTCAVDYGGSVDARRMNADDWKIMSHWGEIGFVRSGRICFNDVERMAQDMPGGRKMTHWVELTDEAWALAHAERRARCVRSTEQRTWRRAEET